MQTHSATSTLSHSHFRRDPYLSATTSTAASACHSREGGVTIPSLNGLIPVRVVRLFVVGDNLPPSGAVQMEIDVDISLTPVNDLGDWTVRHGQMAFQIH